MLQLCMYILCVVALVFVFLLSFLSYLSFVCWCKSFAPPSSSSSSSCLFLDDWLVDAWRSFDAIAGPPAFSLSLPLLSPPIYVGLAWFRLILSCFFLVLGTYSLFRFYRSRWILDIRTRSVFPVFSFAACCSLGSVFSVIYSPFSPTRSSCGGPARHAYDSSEVSSFFWCVY